MYAVMRYRYQSMIDTSFKI